MKFKELFDTSENILFKQKYNEKFKIIDIDKNLIDKVKEWYKYNSIDKRNIEKINDLSQFKSKDLPPIIIHVYNNIMHVIDGWHRLYLIAIIRKEKKIKAYVK